MRVGLILMAYVMLVARQVHARETDTIQNIRLEEVIVTGGNSSAVVRRKSTLPVEFAGKQFLQEHFTGNLVRALEHLPGVHSMDIGSGFSKPLIRGMGFNRVAVVENGVKQEGQQWGADHGLEIDAFNVESVTVLKGPASLLHGSDAMGGVIEITRQPPPEEDRVLGEIVLLGRTVNGTVGGSVMTGMKRRAWYAKARYSEQHFGDYRVPVDTVVYLTQRLPILTRGLKNTAGLERDVAGHLEYHFGRYHAWYAISDAYQKVGFFPGAHGIPDASRLQDDGDSRDIALPYSTVNHLKVTTRQQYAWASLTLSWDAGYQYNHREEQSRFHTHYDGQPLPEHAPNRELAFFLDTYSSSLSLKRELPEWEQVMGWDVQAQRNRIAGYSFLLPRYDRFATGLFGIITYRPSTCFSASGGVRYDRGIVEISAYRDPYLETYLREQGYGDEAIALYRWRAYAVDRRFGDISASLGIVWSPGVHLFKANVGRAFRLPGANELAANGVHHGTFRHEQGDPALSSERGWQVDLSYTFRRAPFTFAVSPFVAVFSNYIYLKPTGIWSALPHAGQIYRYTGARALFAGAELSFGIDFLRGFSYLFTGEYVHTYNRDERTPLSFSPPASLSNTLSWGGARVRCHAEWQHIAPQRRVARNEKPTSGSHLLHAGMTTLFPLGASRAEITLSLQNVLDTRYYNHLSFYRKVEIPEPGRDFRVVIKYLLK
ncbi:MAG: TonB-dependent receptor [Odoribacteraceae bacterium]|jgi:iron complex outermembrane receptor protein|nr:TonB-dependent receptor [Odoribacteraceae bacterium]